MFGMVYEFSDITMAHFQVLSSTGIELDLSQGMGTFSIDTISGTTELKKFINIFFQDETGVENGWALQLTEMI